MISQSCIASYHGTTLNRGGSFLYIAPHICLRPYISNYTITFPTPQTMPDAYTILPTASSTLAVRCSDDGIDSKLRGVDTKATQVGVYANKMKLLLLIEFLPGGMHPFIRVDPSELVDSSVPLHDLDGSLVQMVENELIKADRIEALVEAMDRIFLSRLSEQAADPMVSAVLRHISMQHGNIDAKGLSNAFHYSEKHLRRLFCRHVGVSPKLFSRIVRANHALRLIQRQPQAFANIAAQAGFFDQPHMIRDFKSICGLTPEQYLQNMSVYYNDHYKL